LVLNILIKQLLGLAKQESKAVLSQRAMLAYPRPWQYHAH